MARTDSRAALSGGGHLTFCAPANPGSSTPSSAGWVTCSHSARRPTGAGPFLPPIPTLSPPDPLPKQRGGLGGIRWGYGGAECPILVQFQVSKSSAGACAEPPPSMPSPYPMGGEAVVLGKFPRVSTVGKMGVPLNSGQANAVKDTLGSGGPLKALWEDNANRSEDLAKNTVLPPCNLGSSTVSAPQPAACGSQAFRS